MKLYQSQSGSALLFLLLIFGAMGLVGGAYFLFSGGSRDLASTQDPEILFKELQSKIEKVLNSPEVVHYSIERNPNSFACLYEEDGVCLGKGGLFVMYEDQQSSYSLSQLGTQKGLTYEGLVCDGFPSAQCPFRVEAEWSPVCSLGRCENTKSVKIRVKLLYSGAKPKEWSREGIYAPSLQLSASVNCVRGGGVWAETQCISAQEAQSRQVASDHREQSGTYSTGMDEARSESELSRSQMQSLYVCPDSIVIQGEYYGIEYTADSRGRIRVPAMNGCPAEDIFEFQCVAKSQPGFEGEGHWVQVGASMAPTCDDRGQPVGDPMRI